MTLDAAPDQFIGTELGGGAGSMHDLATWLRDDVAGTVESAGSKLNELLSDTPADWWDAGGMLFALGLAEGRDCAYDLADRASMVAERVEGCADAMSRTQERLTEIEQQAQECELWVEDHRIRNPMSTDVRSYPGQQEPQVTEAMLTRRESFHRLAEDADRAVAPVADKLGEFVEQGGLFDGLIFNAGALVATETSVLAEEATSRLEGKAQHHGMLERYWSRPRGPYLPGIHDDFQRFAERHGWLSDAAERGGRAVGIVGRVLGGWATTAFISGLELYTGLSGDEREGKVIVQVGTNVAAGAGLGAVAFGLFAGAGLVGTVIIVAVVGFVSWGLAQGAAWGYGNFVPESPRDKLERLG